MKTLLTPIFLFVFGFSGLFGQVSDQDPVKLCAQVDKNGTYVSVNVYVSDFVNISSYQFGVAWESDKYTFVGFESINEDAPGQYSPIFDDVPEQLSLVRTLWFDETAITPRTLADETLLYTIKLTQTNPNLTGQIGIAPSDDFLVEFSNGDVELVNYVLDEEGCSILPFVSVLNTKDFIVADLSVSPNPFVDVINIELDEAIDATFFIYSVTGKLIKQIKSQNAKTISLSVNDLEAGAYVLSQETTDGKVIAQTKIVKL